MFTRNYGYSNSNYHDDENTVFPSDPMYGQSYVPIQFLTRTSSPEIGLKMGTIFPELVKPYQPGQSMREIEYLRNYNKRGGECRYESI